MTRNGESSVIGPNDLQPTDTVTLRFAIASGFKNLTILQQKMPTKQFHFVELSACPEGCVNGGGNIPSSALSTGRKESLSQVRARVATARAVHCSEAPSPASWGGEYAAGGFEDSVRRVLSMGLEGGEEGGMRQAWHRVKPLELQIGTVEGVRKDDLGW